MDEERKRATRRALDDVRRTARRQRHPVVLALKTVAVWPLRVVLALARGIGYFLEGVLEVWYFWVPPVLLVVGVIVWEYA